MTGNAVTGKKLYYDHACYSCHGFNGETGARPFVPNWPANLATERSFTAFLRGRANVAPVQPSTSMPNYPVESMSDAQAKDIYAYIRRFKSAQPPVEKIPVMSQILAAAREGKDRDKAQRTESPRTKDFSDTDSERQRDAKLRAAPDAVAPRLDRAAVQFDQAARRRQPDAKPAHV